MEPHLRKAPNSMLRKRDDMLETRKQNNDSALKKGRKV